MDHPLLSLTVNDLSISVRSRNCLAAAGVKAVRELVRMTPRGLLDIPNLGMASVLDIEQALAEHRLRLGMLEKEIRHVLAFNDPGAVEELRAFLDAIAAAGCDDLASLVGREADELLSEGRLDAASLSLLQDGLLKWGVSLGLPVAEGSGPQGEHGAEIPSYPEAASFREELSHRLAHLLRLKPPSWRGCFVAYYGLDGPYPTLDAIGKSGGSHGFGRPVTRERVRQVLTRTRKALQAAGPASAFQHWDPAVERASAEAPMRPGALFTFLGFEPGEYVGLAFKRLNEIAATFGLELPFELQSLGHGETLLFFTSEPDSNAWVKRLRDLPPSPFGSVAEVAEAIGSQEESLRRVVAVSQGWEFLDAPRQYIWRRPQLPPKDFAKTRNAVLTSLCKVFSVPGHALSTDLAMSLGRDRIVRKGGPAFRLPREVVEGIANKSGLFNVEEGEIRRKESVVRWNSLSGRDIALLNVVRRHGRVLSSRDLYSSLVREGLSKRNAGQVVQFSPFIVHTQSGVGKTEGIYKFVLDEETGAHAECEQAVSAAASQSQAPRDRIGFSSTNISLEISARTLQFGTYFGPEAGTLMDGTWTAVLDGVELGKIVVSGQQIAGLKVVAAALLLRKGDRLELLPSEEARVVHCIRS